MWHKKILTVTFALGFFAVVDVAIDSVLALLLEGSPAEESEIFLFLEGATGFEALAMVADATVEDFLEETRVDLADAVAFAVAFAGAAFLGGILRLCNFVLLSGV